MSVFAYLGISLAGKISYLMSSQTPLTTLRICTICHFWLETEIKDGCGHQTLMDKEWLIEGPDLPGGTYVHIREIEGNRLKVERYAG